MTAPAIDHHHPGRLPPAARAAEGKHAAPAPHTAPSAKPGQPVQESPIDGTISGYMRVKRNAASVFQAVAWLWSIGGSSAHREIAAWTAKLPLLAPDGDGTPHGLAQVTVSKILTRWNSQGLAESQLGPTGRPGATWIVNPKGAPLGATFRSAVETALSPDSPLPAAARRQLKTAIRTVLRLQSKAEGERLLVPCQDVAADALYGLPDRVYQAALGATMTKATAENLRGAVRRALRLAVARGAVPVIFPRCWERDAWDELKWAYFPDDASEISRSTVSVYRSNWNDYAREAKAFFCDPDRPGSRETIAPNEITPQMLDELQEHLVRKKGKRYLKRQIRTILAYIARHHGAGPLVGMLPDDSLVVYCGRVNAGYLYDADRKAHTGSWDGFLKILTDNGFPERTIEFFQWYGEYSTLPIEALEAREFEFPERPAVRELNPRTLQKRIIALRAILYQARQVLDPADAQDLSAVFGIRWRKVQSALCGWWKARAQRGEVSDETSSGLTDMVKTAAMVARALYDRSRFLRGVEVMAEDGEVMRTLHVEGMAKTPVEEAYWSAYVTAIRRLQQLEEKRAKSPGGHVNTTIKDIKRMVEQTPHTYWLAVQRECLKRIEEAKKGGEPNGLRYHRLVMITYFLGVLMSTGCRISEATHIRMGTAIVGQTAGGRALYEGQYDAVKLMTLRRMMWRPVDRKNEVAHSAYLRESLCPAWLEKEYLDRSRPWFMARDATNKQRHDFLLVDAWGAPYGCIEESPDGSGRETSSHDVRKADLREAFQDMLMPIAASIGLAIPTAQGEFAPHAIRNVFGYAIFQEFGLTAAANYLGDHVVSVENTYAAVDGTLVDASGLTDFAALTPEAGNAPATANGGERSVRRKAKRTPPSVQSTDRWREREDEALDELLAGRISKTEYADKLHLLREAREISERVSES